MNWTVKNWFVQDFKGYGHNTDEWSDNERLKRVYVPDEDSLEQRMNIDMDSFTVFTEIIANFVFPFSSFFWQRRDKNS